MPRSTSTGGSGLTTAAIHLWADQVCMFQRDGMPFESIVDHMERLASRHVEEGIVTDEVNGLE